MKLKLSTDENYVYPRERLECSFLTSPRLDSNCANQLITTRYSERTLADVAYVYAILLHSRNSSAFWQLYSKFGHPLSYLRRILGNLRVNFERPSTDTC